MYISKSRRHFKAIARPVAVTESDDFLSNATFKIFSRARCSLKIFFIELEWTSPLLSGTLESELKLKLELNFSLPVRRSIVRESRKEKSQSSPFNLTEAVCLEVIGSHCFSSPSSSALGSCCSARKGSLCNFDSLSVLGFFFLLREVHKTLKHLLA